MPVDKVTSEGGGGKWTPGEWAYAHRLDYDCMYYRTQIFTPDNGETIATVHWYPEPKPDGVTGTYRDANAAVLTAAPAMARELAAATAWMIERQSDEYGPRENWPARERIEAQEAALALAEGAPP